MLLETEIRARGREHLQGFERSDALLRLKVVDRRMNSPDRTDGRYETVGASARRDACVHEPAVGMSAFDTFRAKPLSVHRMKLLGEKRLNARADSQLSGFPHLLAQREIEVIDAMAMIRTRRDSQCVLVGSEHLPDRALRSRVHGNLLAGLMASQNPFVQVGLCEVFGPAGVRLI